MSTDGESGGAVAATLEPLFTYGVKPDVHGGVHFTRSDTLLYPSGIFDREWNLWLIES